MFKYYLYKFGQFLVTRLPLQVAYKLAIFVSDLQYLFSFRDRKAVRNNLKVICQTDDNLEKKVRQVFRNFGLYLIDFFRMTKHLNMDYIEKSIRIENRKYLDEVLEFGKGAIILSAHIGNWELGGVVISMLGYPVVALALPHKERPVNDLFNTQRETKGMSVVQTNEASKKCVELLKDNNFIGIIADRDFSTNGEIMDFLDKKAYIPKGPAVFSKKTGAPIIPTFCIRQPDNTFILTIEKPIYPSESNDQSMLDILEESKTIIEQRIRENPTQWLMFRRYWIK